MLTFGKSGGRVFRNSVYYFINFKSEIMSKSKLKIPLFLLPQVPASNFFFSIKQSVLIHSLELWQWQTGWGKMNLEQVHFRKALPGDSEVAFTTWRTTTPNLGEFMSQGRWTQKCSNPLMTMARTRTSQWRDYRPRRQIWFKPQLC